MTPVRSLTNTTDLKKSVMGQDKEKEVSSSISQTKGHTGLSFALLLGHNNGPPLGLQIGLDLAH